MASHLATIYMTQEQDDQLRSSVKQRRQRCEEFQDKAREPRNVKSLLAQATSASLLADMAEATGNQGSESDSLPALEVGYDYLPSTALVANLTSMRLADLRLNVHHLGRVLALRRIGPVAPQKTLSWTVVQDMGTTTDAERLEMVLHDQQHGQSFLECERVHGQGAFLHPER